MKTILAIDPATVCGWAALTGATLSGGTWDLSIRRDESGGMRVVRFEAKLNEIAGAYRIGLVVFEAARNCAPRMQGALVVQAELQGVLKLWCERRRIAYRGYSPSEIKKYATGKGNANKEAMVAAARQRWPEFKGDDNEADARWLVILAERDYAGGATLADVAEEAA